MITGHHAYNIAALRTQLLFYANNVSWTGVVEKVKPAATALVILLVSGAVINLIVLICVGVLCYKLVLKGSM